jgi:hypothetical protein
LASLIVNQGGGFRTCPRYDHIDSITADELEVCNESLGAEADAPSCQQVHREDGSPDQA